MFPLLSFLSFFFVLSLSVYLHSTRNSSKFSCTYQKRHSILSFMAPNKFATMLNRKTNRITVVLVYAVLEWTLIFFLFLNSFFYYLIIKFANYFGLKPPCLLCSRLDHIFEPPNSKSSYRDLICEQHAIELSRSGYCYNHRKLVEKQDMCENCWASSQDHQHPTAALAFRWLKEIGMIKSDGELKVVENCDVNLRCSCCGVAIKSEILAPLAVIKPSSGVLEDTQKAIRDKLLDDVDFDGVLEDTQKAIVDELHHDVNYNGEPDQNGLNSLGIEGKEDGIERSGDIQMGCYSDLMKEDDSSFSLCLSKEDKEDDGIERSREIQMSSHSHLMKEDDTSVGFSLCLSKEGYCLIEADEDEEEMVVEAEREPLLKKSSVSMSYSYADEKIIPQHLEFYIDLDDYQLIPVELTNLEMEMSKGESQFNGEEGQKNMDREKFNELWTETDEGLVLEPEVMVAPAALDTVEKLNSSFLDLLELDETKNEDLPYKVGQEQELVSEVDTEVNSAEATVKDLPSNKGQEEEEIKREVGTAVVLDEHKVEISAVIEGQVEVATKEIDFHFAGDQECDVLLTSSDDQVTKKCEDTELNANIPTSDFGDVCHRENDETDIVSSGESEMSMVEPLRPCEDKCPSTNDVICEASTSSIGLLEKEPMQTEETKIKDVTVEITELELQSDVALSHELNELEGGQIPDTPNSVASTANEVNNGEEGLTNEELMALLESERKKSHALYAELDEERNAAATATNETMAMIQRLQEEKATIEMEALQYQRLMEEQSEYDQEALQLMNEMLVKREKELQELEKELDICRRKVMDYEERERMRLLSQRKGRSCTRSRTSSASCSHEEESDGLSVDLNSESREEDSSCKCEENGKHPNTPVDAILDLQDPSSSFEEERISILEQLKVLEEKLCTLAEEEEHHIVNMKPFEQFYEENAEDFDRSFINNGDANGLENGKHHEEKKMNGSMAKQLLPLFDAAEFDSEDEVSNSVEDGYGPLAIHNKPLPTKFELEKKRLAIEDELDHAYERLHALEADREFIKHCFGSLRKGDKGVHLLQEILEHLRDLKNIELQARIV